MPFRKLGTPDRCKDQLGICHHDAALALSTSASHVASRDKSTCDILQDTKRDRMGSRYGTEDTQISTSYCNTWLLPIARTAGAYQACLSELPEDRAADMPAHATRYETHPRRLDSHHPGCNDPHAGRCAFACCRFPTDARLQWTRSRGVLYVLLLVAVSAKTLVAEANQPHCIGGPVAGFSKEK